MGTLLPLRRRLHTSSPSKPGIIQSKIAKSGGLSRAIVKPEFPSEAVATL
jgi:hypothetical protein